MVIELVSATLLVAHVCILVTEARLVERHRKLLEGDKRHSRRDGNSLDEEHVLDKR